MECSEYLPKTVQLLINLYVIYCMPSTGALTFCNDLANLTELNITENRGKVPLVRDFNIHLDEPAHSDTILFNDTLESLDLQNMVKPPTHRSGHILDVTITECNSPLVSSVHIGHQFSDDKFFHPVLSTTKPVLVEMTVKYQKIKNINIDKFGSDVRNYCTDHDQERSLEELLTHYNEMLLGTHNKHAQLCENKCKITHRQPWCNDRIKQELVLRRKLKCKWLNDQTEYNFQAFYYQR